MNVTSKKSPTYALFEKNGQNGQNFIIRSSAYINVGIFKYLNFLNIEKKTDKKSYHLHRIVYTAQKSIKMCFFHRRVK